MQHLSTPPSDSLALGSPQNRAEPRGTLLPQVTSLRLKVILAHSSRPQLDTTCKSDTFIKPKDSGVLHSPVRAFSFIS